MMKLISSEKKLTNYDLDGLQRTTLQRERERDSNHKLILLDGLQRTKNKQQQSQRNLNQNSIKKNLPAAI
jgi:hypothetical protein